MQVLIKAYPLAMGTTTKTNKNNVLAIVIEDEKQRDDKTKMYQGLSTNAPEPVSFWCPHEIVETLQCMKAVDVIADVSIRNGNLQTFVRKIFYKGEFVPVKVKEDDEDESKKKD
ncbi:MAG: hypothetical protein E7353_00165 [Clostridiales bacterium]|nr:hypothetical protein [Clostridiales bacterium]